MRREFLRRVAGAICTWALLADSLTRLSAQDQTPPPREPAVAAASQEGRSALALIQLPAGMRAQLYAAEPKVANPVAIHIDSQNRLFVCESFRQEAGIEDNREHGHWLLDDLAAQSVADRVSYIKKHLGDRAVEYTRQDDRIRILEDTDGDGIADQSTLFASGFNKIESGTGAGVLPYRDRVYYTCIPDLWQLTDTNGDGAADQRASLHSGFGVRFAFRGHDMHGLIVGPDRRLYFSIGDRGYNVSPEIRDPSSGAVFRCELDGSGLEVIATGLRNPQELAFDRYGNLFTGDNNSDSGDRARWVYVVPGGDSGWRMEYQYLPDRGPFNREKIWHPFHPETPAYIVPPVANLADGPSGLAYYPGTGLSADYDDRFFLCDFRGQTELSGIRTIKVEPRGAFFEVVQDEPSIWRVLATDVAFGIDSKMYVSDWVHGWVGEGKGRIFTLSDPVVAESEQANQVFLLLSGGFSEIADADLMELLGHPDQRVRQEAQFELSDRDVSQQLIQTLISSSNQLSRIHALWALEIKLRIYPNDPQDFVMTDEAIMRLLRDSDDRIRAQVARACETNFPGPVVDAALIDRLGDSSSRVRYFAALALGKRGVREAAEGIFELLNSNADRDPILRHAGIMALTWMNDVVVLEQAIEHPATAVRLAATVALRKLSSPLLAELLDDPEDKVVLEAARAIHDLPLPSLFGDLAGIERRAASSDHLARRFLNANYVLGGVRQARIVARVAADSAFSLDLRNEALDLLGQWAQPAPLDRVLGTWRPIPPRDATVARNAIRENLTGLLGGDSQIAQRAMAVAAIHQIEEVIPALTRVFENTQSTVDARSSALIGLHNAGAPALGELIEQGVASDLAMLRAVSLGLLADRDDERAVDLLAAAVQSRDRFERQTAFTTLSRLRDVESAKLLKDCLSRVDEIPQDTHLDLFRALQARVDNGVDLAWTSYSAVADRDPLGKFLATLQGGDSERGREIFFTRTDVGCLRCHQVHGVGGAVGPDLSKIGSQRDRKYLMESIVSPNLNIPEEFETLVVLDTDGLTHVGVRKHEDDETLRLMTAEGNSIAIQQEHIDDLRRGQSAMPEDIVKKLSLEDIRDLIEFLAEQK